MKIRLFTPGPTPVPERVALRMAAPLPHHRSDEFRAVLARVHTRLGSYFQTSGPVLALTCSGTGVMEALVTNLFSPGDTVIAVNGGKFGARWTELLNMFGMIPVEITVPWGHAVDPIQIRDALRLHRQARGVLLTHSETSSGTAIDLRNIAAAIHDESEALVCVDGISSVGAMEFLFDSWGIDACITASQKGLMIPPGLGFVALSKRAIDAVNASVTPRFYLDFRRALAAHERNDTPWTPAISLLIGLDEALEMIEVEGLPAVWKRHERHSAAIRAGLEAIGLRLFSERPSPAVTAAWLPESVPWEAFRDILRKEFGYWVAGGQGDFTGKIFRVSNLGYHDDADILGVIDGIERALAGLRRIPGQGFALGAARAFLS
ncbi:MAG: alanine--glyoxylate aminotransferase family protein [Bacteroidota bacterium]